ncbi:MAG TPA: tRNA (adenosine(37)-N6)-threonylcarbamoyltransferase complex transferase subunit TsaD [Cytophagales bacterium]|nr:tRNA (adenosine(37)-N6)-threonylcarbamoyltransferase complex transferase subunit TsaD [Cytophagales bacterium]HAA19516.1 tRNA (adenosine(37)-N6)-threonylcarbamoyltransferase complex transferase subunit TsaD [Cytophagales bacterium]HAP59610.1 tRNA (adenosine(37)-N6)-threonylcarbamoyltransferase complex transferase subunit TsaD [Cytophagales bacterium]
MTNFTILAIESSCDETSAAVLHNGKVLNNVIATQSVHENYGGVVPELASRAHQQNIVPTVAEALNEAAMKTEDLSAIAFTRGPGLLGSLLVGTSFAKGLALAHDIPLIEVNHMQAHVLAHFIEDPKPAFPFLCLTVSGGHTQLVKVTGPLEMEVIGQTQDDAVGEAFDKAAKMFGLPYPGGPHLDKLAQQGNPDAFPFTETDMPDLDFSFSGIKTGILYFLQKQERKDPDFVQKHLADLCASVQKALVSMLLKKLKKAAKQTGIKEIAIAGGVSANSGLRTSLLALGENMEWNVFIPKFEYCTDNAAMIAKAAEFKFQAGEFADQSISPLARMPL